MPVVTRTDRSARPRAPLSRERVLRAAIVLADKSGIESLSMRKLGQVLGVEAMSLYNHVANKDDLLDGLVDLVVGEIEVPAIGSDWKPAMRKRATSAREVLSRHPWASGVMESRIKPGAATLRYHDSVLGILRRAGFSVEMAAHAFSILDSYVFGFGVQELNMPIGSPEEVAKIAKIFLRQLRDDQYPYLAEMTEHAVESGYDQSDEFEFGLDLILDGLERARHPQRKTKTRRRG
jgi:AcrR family transcriptional regulator